jgi:hypothetical protein
MRAATLEIGDRLDDGVEREGELRRADEDQKRHGDHRQAEAEHALDEAREEEDREDGGELPELQPGGIGHMWDRSTAGLRRRQPPQRNRFARSGADAPEKIGFGASV